jgi:hypothetical protein
MAINFKLKPVRTFSPEGDDMDRSWVGYDRSHPPQRTYEQNRGVWWIGPRAESERWATFSADGHIKVVVELDGLETIPSKKGTRAKRAIVGRVLAPGHPVHDYFIDRAVNTHRNPVSYIPDPE